VQCDLCRQRQTGAGIAVDQEWAGVRQEKSEVRSQNEEVKPNAMERGFYFCILTSAF
jgi:hypothetical protein